MYAYIYAARACANDTCKQGLRVATGCPRIIAAFFPQRIYELLVMERRDFFFDKYAYL